MKCAHTIIMSIYAKIAWDFNKSQELLNIYLTFTIMVITRQFTCMKTTFIS